MLNFPKGETFGLLLKAHRNNNGYSQIQLCELTNTTTRNLSNLETGKILPTRQMVKRFATSLSLNAQGYSELMRAAGYVYDSYTNEEMEEYQREVQVAVKLILDNHEPFPAMAINRRYDLTGFNKGLDYSYQLYKGADYIQPNLPLSLFELLFGIDSFNESFTENEQAARFLIQRVHREQLNNAAASDLISELQEKLPNIPESWWEFDPDYQPSPNLRVSQIADGIRYDTIGVIHSIGNPHDFGGNSTRVILIYPMNKAAKDYYLSIEKRK